MDSNEIFYNMKTNKNPSQYTTTVCVDAVTRDRINDEAERLGLSQRQMIQRLLESYETELKLASEEHDTQTEENLLKRIHDSLDKVIKRDDRIVAFIKEQEKILLNPILNTVQAIDANLNQLVEILSNIE